VLVALLLLLAGVESNPGVIAATLKLGVFNVQSAVRKASLLHDVITEHRIDLLVVTQDMDESYSTSTVTQEIVPAGFQVLRRFRGDVINGGGVALIYANFLMLTS